MSERPEQLSRPQKTVPRDAHASRTPKPATPPAEDVQVSDAPPVASTPVEKGYVEILAEHKKATSSERAKVTMSLEPAVLNTLRDVKKFHRIPSGVAVDLAVKHLYKDLYEKNLQELEDLGGA